MVDESELKKLFEIPEKDAFDIKEASEKLKRISKLMPQMMAEELVSTKDAELLNSLNQVTDFILEKFPVEKRST